MLVDADLPEMDGFRLIREMRAGGGITGPLVMMLNPANPPASEASFQEWNVASRLMKPVLQAELLEAMRQALGASPEYSKTREPSPNAYSRERRNWNVLLAEDNPVNQLLARRILERWGCTVTIACDGLQAVQACDQQSFHAILMDVQMPQLDGFEATALIREKERGLARHVPILALTAHATSGYREQCLAAGMDDYIAKPLTAKQLLVKLDQLAAPPAHTP